MCVIYDEGMFNRSMQLICVYERSVPHDSSTYSKFPMLWRPPSRQ